MNVEELFRKQAVWQAQQKDKSWEEKLQESLILREAALLLQASNPSFSTKNSPLQSPDTRNKNGNQN